MRAEVSPTEFSCPERRPWQRRGTGTRRASAGHAAPLPSAAAQPSPEPGTCPRAEQLLPPTLDWSHLQPVRLSAWVTSRRRNTKLNTREVGAGGLLDRNIRDFSENLARGLFTGHFSVYFVQDEPTDTYE